MQVSLVALRDTITDPIRLQSWKEQCQPIARARFRQWAQSKKPISLFRQISALAIHVLLHLFMGPDFANSHAEELVPLIQGYETMLQKPQGRALPRWATGGGRFLQRAEARMDEVVSKELERRLADPEKYKGNTDWFQVLISRIGKQFYDGISRNSTVNMD
jgi:cytochrome P450